MQFLEVLMKIMLSCGSFKMVRFAHALAVPCECLLICIVGVQITSFRYSYETVNWNDIRILYIRSVQYYVVNPRIRRIRKL